MNQTALIAALAALVFVLFFLLISRIIREKKRTAAASRLSLETYSELIRANSIEGTIVDVAKKVSDLLIGSFGCDRIVFLRKKKGSLELNYYHGIKGFSRSDFRIGYSRDLAETLRADFLPRSVERLRQCVSEKFSRKLREYQIDTFFPISWRDNLYGVYFIHSTMDSDSSSFNLLVASLAQSLSAAYHVKWHESKYDAACKRREDAGARLEKKKDGSGRLFNVIKLVRHHDSKTLVSTLMETIKDAVGMTGLVYLYESKGDSNEPQILSNGVERSVSLPDIHVFRDVLRAVEKGDHRELGRVQTKSQMADSWIQELRESGLRHVALFPLTSRRRGMLAWSSDEPADVVQRQLELLKPHTDDLMENAESFQRIEEMSYTDDLTGLANQRYFFKRLDEEINRAKRYNRNLALIIFDLDELKYTNDTYGHLAGDAILKQMGEILRRSIRAIDVIARYGGDEFCVVMPEADETTCRKFMGRLQSHVFRSKFTVDGVEESLNCTVSIGGAIFPHHGQTAKALVFAADMALLKAKETGRNKSLIYSTST